VAPAPTADVDFWTKPRASRIIHPHPNYIVSDESRSEQSAAHHIHKNQAAVASFKNAGLGFSVLYFNNAAEQ
jgi:hypothetical protein